MVKRAAGALLSAIRIDHDSPRLLATQITSSIREIILAGGLRGGDRLPATRILARDLGVSRTTIVEVYERLISEGLLEARTGAGTFVSETVHIGDNGAVTGSPEAPKTEKAVARPPVAIGAGFAIRLPHTIRAFTTALPAVDMFPVAQWTRQSNKHWREQRDLVLGYGSPAGFPPLRRAIVAHLKANQGINCDEDQIFVTNGAQHAFHIIASMLLKQGDKVWFENPGAIGAQNALRAAGGELVPLPIDSDGLDVAAGLADAPDFRLAFVTPLHQQPLGVTMSLERRFALLNAAENADAWIIEDDYDGEFYYGTHPIPTLKSIDHADRVFYVGTFSKTLFPALRLGYILAPPSFVGILNHLFNTWLPSAPLNSQAIVAGFMDEGHFATHLRRMRRIYTERYQVLMRCASELLDGLLTLKPTDTGLHTTGRLASGLAENTIAEAANDAGITVTPFGRYAMTPLDKTGLVLGFSGVPPEDIEQGVRGLARILGAELAQQQKDFPIGYLIVTDTFDYIVVGAGSAGCALAARLSESGRHRVLLLEAGGDDRQFWIQVPIGYGKSFYDPSVNWMYMSEPVPTAGNRQTYWPRGKVLGGSSSINAMVYIRGQAEDYGDWEAAGNPGWGWDDVLPVYKRMECHQWGESAWHGGSGPLKVTAPEAELHPLCADFLTAGTEAGVPVNPDFNGASQEGVGPYHITTGNGFRMSAARAYLWPARNRANLKIETHADAERLLFDGSRVTGVSYRCHGVQRTATAEAEVIVAAGAVGSPALLLRSGVGPASELAELGIRVQTDRPAVGRNLMDHYIVDQMYRSRRPSLNNTLAPWWGRALAGMQYLLDRRGPVSLSLNQAGGFIRTRSELARPNMQLYFSPLSYTKAPPGKRPLMHPDPYAAFLTSISQCRPTSRGWLKLRSADPHETPEIQPNYLSTEFDLQENLEGFKFIRKLAETPTMREVIEEEVSPGPDVRSDDEMVDYFRNTGGSVFHPSGTCRMGPDPAMDVVRPDLRVYGLENLRVADASIFPTIPSGNTNAPSIMVGEKASDIILGNR